MASAAKICPCKNRDRNEFNVVLGLLSGDALDGALPVPQMILGTVVRRDRSVEGSSGEVSQVDPLP